MPPTICSWHNPGQFRVESSMIILDMLGLAPIGSNREIKRRCVS